MAARCHSPRTLGIGFTSREMRRKILAPRAPLKDCSSRSAIASHVPSYLSMLLELSAPSCARYPAMNASTEYSRACRKNRTHNSKSPSARNSVLSLPPAVSHNLRLQYVDSCWTYLFAPARNRIRDHRGTGQTFTVIPAGLNFVGLPVIHSTSASSANTLPTTNNPLFCSISLAFSQPMISPLARENPVFNASYTPLSGWLTHHAIFSSYCRIISTVPSVDPPSTMIYSRFG